MTKIFDFVFLTYLVENETWIYFKAMSSPNTSYWKEILNIKIEFIMNNYIWKLMDFIFKSKLLNYKWIFKRKMKADDTIDKYKIKFLVKCFRQHKGMNNFNLYVSIITIIWIYVHICVVSRPMSCEPWMKPDYNSKTQVTDCQYWIY